MKSTTVLTLLMVALSLCLLASHAASVQKLDSSATMTAKGCSFGGTCCFSSNGRLNKCPHVGGVCCPRSRYCCPANHVCAGNSDQPACRQIGSDDSCGGSGCVSYQPANQGCGNDCESSEDSQLNIPIKVIVEKNAQPASQQQPEPNIPPLDGVSELAKSLPAGVTITNTRSSRNGMTVTTTLTKQGSSSNQGSLAPSSFESSEASESSEGSHFESSEGSHFESSHFESSHFESSRHESSARPMHLLESSELSAPTLPPPIAGTGSPLESGDCGSGDCTPKRGKLKINSNVEITIGGKKQA